MRKTSFFSRNQKHVVKQSTVKQMTGSINSDMLLYFHNNPLKSISVSDGTIGAYSVVWGTEGEKDFHGNWFTKNTFLGHNRGNGAVATLNHRIPFFKSGQFDGKTEAILKQMSKRIMKNPVRTSADNIGLFSTLIMDLSDEYEKMVYDLAKAGKLKWSSGTAPQLFDADETGELKTFVIAEQALTPIPAEYRMLNHRVMPIKSYMEFLKHQGPGNHPSGSSQDVHGGDDQKSDNLLRDGVKIKFKGEDEVFTVSQWDENRQRGWASDANGRGWYFHANQVEIFEDEDQDWD